MNPSSFPSRRKRPRRRCSSPEPRASVSMAKAGPAAGRMAEERFVLLGRIVLMTGLLSGWELTGRFVDPTWISMPSLIAVRTTIGFGSPKKAGTSSAHGSPLGKDEVAATKRALGWDPEAPFLVPDEARAHSTRVKAGSKWTLVITAAKAVASSPGLKPFRGHFTLETVSTVSAWRSHPRSRPNRTGAGRNFRAMPISESTQPATPSTAIPPTMRTLTIRRTMSGGGVPLSRRLSGRATCRRGSPSPVGPPTATSAASPRSRWRSSHNG